MDNTRLNQNVSIGDLIATYEDSNGVKHERVIVQFLDPFGQPIMVSADDPMPVYIVSTTSLQFIVATAGQTVFSFTGVPVDAKNFIISANGIELYPTYDFTFSGNDITLLVPRDLDDLISFRRLQ